MNKNKRLTLKASVLSSAFLSSPAWIKPVVNTVVLPAHAQTSSLPGTLTLIDSFLTDTGANDNDVTVCYQVDDRPVSGSSEPTLVTVDRQTNDATICINTFGFFASGVRTETDNFVRISAGSTSQTHSVSLDDNTAQDPTSTPSITFSEVPATVRMVFLSVSGNPWELNYSVSQVGTNAFMVSDVILSSI